MDPAARDGQLRSAVFAFLAEQTSLLGEILPWRVLTTAFQVGGEPVPLLGAAGIWKPKVFPELPLSIATAPPVPGEKPPYEDGIDENGLLVYRYRGTDPGHRDNVGLRGAMARQAPLVYMVGVRKGYYLPIWPVYVVADSPPDLAFKVAVDDRQLAALPSPQLGDHTAEARRSYVTRLTLHRLHQQTFRQRVLHAYLDRCAVCRLKHVELLEAAHILPDGHPKGEPVVPNGLALCKLHHAAFDRHILGIRPDLVVEIRKDILEEIDGPMLKHGLQEMAGKKLHVPKAGELRPNGEFLEERFALFRRAG